MRWKRARPADRYRSKTRITIRSSCSSRPVDASALGEPGHGRTGAAGPTERRSRNLGFPTRAGGPPRYNATFARRSLMIVDARPRPRAIRALALLVFVTVTAATAGATATAAAAAGAPATAAAALPASPQAASPKAAALPAPPETPKKPVSTTYHGVKVTDDYQWLENWSDP